MASTTKRENRFNCRARLHSYQLRLAAAANPDPPHGRHAEEVLSRSGRAISLGTECPFLGGAALRRMSMPLMKNECAAQENEESEWA